MIRRDAGSIRLNRKAAELLAGGTAEYEKLCDATQGLPVDLYYGLEGEVAVVPSEKGELRALFKSGAIISNRSQVRQIQAHETDRGFSVWAAEAEDLDLLEGSQTHGVVLRQSREFS